MKSINSISEFHRLLSLPEPFHPLISVARVEDIRISNDSALKQFFLNFYSLSFKKNVKGKMKYGQQYYDFDKGTMVFTAPKQIQSHDMSELTPDSGFAKGYVLFFHPSFLNNHPLSSTIKTYGFFSYAVNEALHLSEREQLDVVNILYKIDEEHRHTDSHTQDIILSQLDLLLNYCKRFYDRQFITRKSANSDLLIRMEQMLNDYFQNEESLTTGVPTVEYFASKLNLSAHYLSDMLRTQTGKSAQFHIHEKLIEKAKEYLTITKLSVAEIAYKLGFEYPQSFNKLFKKKTDYSPLEFRQTFN